MLIQFKWIAASFCLALIFAPLQWLISLVSNVVTLSYESTTEWMVELWYRSWSQSLWMRAYKICMCMQQQQQKKHLSYYVGMIKYAILLNLSIYINILLGLRLLELTRKFLNANCINTCVHHTFFFLSLLIMNAHSCTI